MVIPLAHWTRGEAEAALQVAQEGMDLATRIGAIMRQCQGAIFLGALMAARGEYERALSVCADGQRVAATLGGYAMVYTPHLDAAQILASLDLGLAGYRETAAECAGQIVDMGDLAGAWGWEALGAVALAEGDPARASAWFERGLTQPSMFWLLRRPYLSLGAAAAARATGDLDRAAVQIDEARAFADEHGMAPVGPLAALEQGRLCLARGELASALEHLARARELAAALQMRPIVWQALAETARALTALARADDAEAARAEAQRVITAISAGMTPEHLRAAFAEQAARQLGHPDENQHER